MNFKKLTLTYLTSYLAIGGIGFALFPSQVLRLFSSNGDYGDVMPRITGMFMCALSYFIYKILQNEDWKYFFLTIKVRSGIVLFMTLIYFYSSDPMFLILDVVVLIGLIPSVIIHYKNI